jgi:hypothetical protein
LITRFDTFDGRALDRRRGGARFFGRACGEQWRDHLQCFAAHNRPLILFRLDVVFALQT